MCRKSWGTRLDVVYRARNTVLHQSGNLWLWDLTTLGADVVSGGVGSPTALAIPLTDEWWLDVCIDLLMWVRGSLAK